MTLISESPTLPTGRVPVAILWDHPRYTELLASVHLFGLTPAKFPGPYTLYETDELEARRNPRRALYYHVRSEPLGRVYYFPREMVRDLRMGVTFMGEEE